MFQHFCCSHIFVHSIPKGNFYFHDPFSALSHISKSQHERSLAKWIWLLVFNHFCFLCFCDTDNKRISKRKKDIKIRPSSKWYPPSSKWNLSPKHIYHIEIYKIMKVKTQNPGWTVIGMVGSKTKWLFNLFCGLNRTFNPREAEE